MKNRPSALRISFRIASTWWPFWVLRWSFTATPSAGHSHPSRGGGASGCFRSLRNATNNSATFHCSSAKWASVTWVRTRARPTTATCAPTHWASRCRPSAPSIPSTRMRWNSAATCCQPHSRIRGLWWRLHPLRRLRCNDPDPCGRSTSIRSLLRQLSLPSNDLLWVTGCGSFTLVSSFSYQCGCTYHISGVYLCNLT